MASPKSALIVSPHWAELIVAGTKSWELRGTACKKRGRIAIGASKSGTLIGEVTVVDSVKVMENGVSLLPLPLADFQPLHCVTDLNIIKYKAVHAWVMTNAIRYERPREFVHNPGAVIWVSLDGKSQKRKARKHKTRKRKIC